MSKIGRNQTDCIPDIFELLPIREYRCEFDCGKVFKNRSPYELHLQKKHGVDIQENVSQSFRCPVGDCDYVGARLGLLRRHYQSHHMEKKYECSACNRKFLLESRFLKHRCEVQIYNCHNCLKFFHLLSMRNRHVKRCVKRSITSIPSHPISKAESLEKVGESVHCVGSQTDDELTIDEFEQLLQNIENKVVKDPALIEELASLTPLLQSLQS